MRFKLLATNFNVTAIKCSKLPGDNLSLFQAHRAEVLGKLIQDKRFICILHKISSSTGGYTSAYYGHVDPGNGVAFLDPDTGYWDAPGLGNHWDRIISPLLVAI